VAMECCLFVCCRPSTSSRLISSLYPKDTTGYEEKLLPMKLKRLIEYILAYPKKLPHICDILERRIRQDYQQQKIGYVMIGMETFRGICKDCSFQPDILEAIDPSLIRCLKLIFASNNLKYLELGYPIFLEYTDCNVETSFSHFLQPILQLCQPSPSSSSETILIGLKYLYRIIGILTPSSGELEKHLPTLLPLLFYFYSHGAGGKGKGNGCNSHYPFEVEPTNEIFVDDDGTLTPHDLSASCLDLLLQNPSPTTSSHVLRLLFRVWDRQLWEPIEAISSCLVRFHQILGSSSHYHPSLSSLLTSHAYFLLTDSTIPVPPTTPSATNTIAYESPLSVSITPSFQKIVSPTTLGSEYLIRTFPRRCQLIQKILHLIHDIYSSQEHSKTTPHVIFTTLSSERMLEHLSYDESIVYKLCQLLEFLSRQWGDEALLLRNLPDLFPTSATNSSSQQSSAPELFLTHTSHLYTFLVEFINTKEAQLPVNFCKRDRVHDSTPSHSERSEACHSLFIDTLSCFHAMIPTLPSAKYTVSILLHLNEMILSCDQSQPQRSTLSPLSHNKAEKIYRLLLLFSLHTTLQDFLINFSAELTSHGISDIFSYHKTEVIATAEVERGGEPPRSQNNSTHTLHLSNYLTPLCSYFNSISPSPIFSHHLSSVSASASVPSSSASMPHLSVYILLSTQQLCQYITLFTNTSLTLHSSSSSSSPSSSSPTEALLLQLLISTVLQEIISVERLISLLFTVIAHEKSQQFHPSVLAMLYSSPPNHFSLSSSASLPSSAPAAVSATHAVGYVVISQRNQILRDFIFHQLCSQTNNLPDTQHPHPSPCTGRIFLCKVQMMWNIQVSPPPCPFLTALPLPFPS
jgi:hypothetical protein